MSRLLPLRGLDGVQAGGKANGLARLMAMGLPVPDGFVLIDVDIEHLPLGLASAYAALGGGAVAVRSSALDEDGHDASFAGQYETVLNVQGSDALEAAIRRCVNSLDARRVNAYRGQVPPGKMCVIVQKMVTARAAGVLFTVDPVSARRDILVIDAVQSLGDVLVNGDITPDHYELDTNNVLVHSAIAGDQSVLSPALLRYLAQTARQAAQYFGEPLDMEWAVDQHGHVSWLQARPITALPADLCEFDEPARAADIFTTGNIGEMMPGAVCPLTMSITLRGIEYGFQHLDILLGAQKTFTERFTQVCSFYGHWFFNLTGKVAAAGHVAGMDAQEAGFSLCGQAVPELRSPPARAWWVRARGGWRFWRWLLCAEQKVDQFAKRLATEFGWMPVEDPSGMMLQIEGLVWWVFAAEDVHVCSSASSAVAGSILQRVFTRGELPSLTQLGELARWMAGASGVESAELVQALDTVAQAVVTSGQAEAFVSQDAVTAATWLQTHVAVSEPWTRFLQRHGHRAYRELCLREKGWAEDPLPLVTGVQTAVRSLLHGANATASLSSDEPTVGKGSTRFMRWWLPRVHAGVRRRERSKSQLVRVTRETGKAYRHLGRLLVVHQVLPDEDLIYFFTHEELRACRGMPSVAQVQRAVRRRQALPYQAQLRMPFLATGKPVPLRQWAVSGGAVLAGRPVSCGVVEGPCRVALSPEEAVAVQPGEILITPVTDVAWTPYFSVIAGLATDIGSAVSHGAVIAREYGLPAVVNLRDATHRCRTGMRVRLDGGAGTLTLLEDDQVG